ncbi:acetyltransferase [Acinetobacter soli]|uniref:GNAT family N-acetyltransferase n=1 Tax=Acinetobacter soli TaxID=487316 RepID=UPI001ABCC92E|nr:GNAT family N-acetyltransferase [Acinetobacter soli]MBO3639964.1 acetyltransferase [Acinetobacter soli]MBU3119866.1 acetyltransferase [Acinetobacter soli]MBV6549474.1 acetyltransferase [Acinetobacter soli]MCB8768602.1 acetyltransferase [Acinetobacter soli]MDS7694823.1 acetyltransferase [Acinetobacter soli]
MQRRSCLSTRSSRLPDHFDYQVGEVKYGLREVCLEHDLRILHRWMHEPHVIPQWKLNISQSDLAVHFEKMHMDDHQRLYIIQIDASDVGYLEIYEAARDRLALYYAAHPDDMGWHILLGEKSVVGKGHFRAVMKMMCQFVFQHTPALKIVGEPDITVRSYAYVADQIAFEAKQILNMPEKQAVLYHCDRDRFLQLCGESA